MLLVEAKKYMGDVPVLTDLIKISYRKYLNQIKFHIINIFPRENSA